jgi:hypothetical protein
MSHGIIEIWNQQMNSAILHSLFTYFPEYETIEIHLYFANPQSDWSALTVPEDCTYNVI